MNGKEKKVYYVTMRLIKVTDPDTYLYDKKVSYWAVDEETADSMLDSGFDHCIHHSLQKIRMELLGEVQVELEDFSL